MGGLYVGGRPISRPTRGVSGVALFFVARPVVRCMESADPVTDEDLKNAVKQLTPAGTQEVADYVGLSRQGTTDRLSAIEDRYSNPWVWSKKIGPTHVWLHADHVFPR
jgi:hypothetical protein